MNAGGGVIGGAGKPMSWTGDEANEAPAEIEPPKLIEPFSNILMGLEQAILPLAASKEGPALEGDVVVVEGVTSRWYNSKWCFSQRRRRRIFGAMVFILATLPTPADPSFEFMRI